MNKWIKTHLRLPRIKPKMPYISAEKWENFTRETGLIGFFVMFGVGLYLISPALCFIVCGLMGIWFCFPRRLN